MKNLLEMQKIIYENLTGENTPGVFGEQTVMNENDKITGINKRLLIGATELSAENIVDITHELLGAAIASHVDREGFGIIGKLGFIPPGLKLDAVEISPRISYGEALKSLHLEKYPVITSSDAHYLQDIGKSFTAYYMKEISVEELKKAFLKEEGRYIKIQNKGSWGNGQTEMEYRWRNTEYGI